MKGGVKVTALADGHGVVARASRELFHVPLADDASFVAAVRQFTNVARGVGLEFATEIERAGDVGVLAADDAGATWRADGVVAADVGETHALGGESIDRRRVHVILQPRAVCADALGRVVVGHHEQDVRPLGCLRLAKREQGDETEGDRLETFHAKRQLPFGCGGLKAKLGQAPGYLSW